ncbi:S-4TM family putative pore-forming effector [Streptomyces sp. NRRL F-525]|uniref:S-4TM family putative pore-forming effector n=1 Tax=Streptomyces sp. NRRL F-525 TaxID=1463861 RepID=UPI000526A077|nr:S-4TM family putative pore-forming effector [Streptomyces sp. NRRL F-525]
MGSEPVGGSRILSEQNGEAAQQRLRAMEVSHLRAQRLANARMGVSVLLAATGLVTVFLPDLTAPVTVLGGVWAVAHSVGLTSWESSESRRAALLQESFDVRLFQLEWNGPMAGSPPSPQLISSLSRRFAGDEAELRDYYEIPELPHPYAVLACQQQNLGWGARVRRRYARTVLTSLLIWLGLGLVIGLSARMSVLDLLLLWYVPSLGAVLMGVEVCRTQWRVITDRERVMELLEARVAAGGDTAALLVFARQIQDVIFQSRQRHTRVPGWFFRRFKSADRADFQAAMHDLQNVVARATPQPG